MTKTVYILFVIFFLFSCASKEKKNDSLETIKKSDTAIVNTTPVNPYSIVDISPMDMSYFPVDYSKRKMAHDITTPPVMRVIYSRPHKQGRVIFGRPLHYLLHSL